ncbi:MAG: accessory gene regulator B family protein [Eubacterium sp.]|nr:accessory gene regulator B family protein [Eubacterium sp.]
MIEKIVDKLLDAQIKSGSLKDETIPIYRYGYTLLIEVTINIMISLFIGFAMGEIGIVIIFNLIFIPLRGFCGGWHAKKSWLCTVTSTIVLLFSTFIGKGQLFQYGTSLWATFLGISYLIILFLAPVDSEAKKLSDDEVIHYKEIIQGILFVILVLFVLFVYFKIYQLAGVLCFAVYVQSASLLFAFLINDRKKENRDGGKESEKNKRKKNCH